MLDLSRHPKGADASSALRVTGFVDCAVPYPLRRKGGLMNKTRAPTLFVEPDPQALECSILYLKEKLEYAAESFEGSAVFNKKQSFRFRIMVGSSCLTTILFVCLSMLSHNANVSLVTQTVALSASILTLCLLCWLGFRDYKSSWLVHAHASSRIKRLENKLAFFERTLGVSEKILEEFYGEYRSVYDDTNGTLHDV